MNELSGSYFLHIATQKSRKEWQVIWSMTWVPSKWFFVVQKRAHSCCLPDLLSTALNQCCLRNRITKIALIFHRWVRKMFSKSRGSPFAERPTNIITIHPLLCSYICLQQKTHWTWIQWFSINKSLTRSSADGSVVIAFSRHRCSCDSFNDAQRTGEEWYASFN